MGSRFTPVDPCYCRARQLAWCPARSWLLAPGSWLLAPGSWLLAPGSWLLAPALLAPGSWLLRTAWGSSPGCARPGTTSCVTIAGRPSKALVSRPPSAKFRARGAAWREAGDSLSARPVLGQVQQAAEGGGVGQAVHEQVEGDKADEGPAQRGDAGDDEDGASEGDDAEETVSAQERG